MAPRKEKNIIRTSAIEHEIAMACATRDYAAADVWRQVARVVWAPIDESKIKDERALIEEAIKADNIAWAAKAS